jgi:hypothetical protein
LGVEVRGYVTEKKIGIGIVGLAVGVGFAVPLALLIMGRCYVIFVRVNQVLVRLWALLVAFV